jgi:hypothetical protein
MPADLSPLAKRRAWLLSQLALVNQTLGLPATAGGPGAGYRWRRCSRHGVQHVSPHARRCPICGKCFSPDKSARRKK